MRSLSILLSIGWLALGTPDACAIDPYLGNDPYWVLLHEPAVIEELKLGSSQRSEYSQLLDELDLRFFPLRNKSYEEAASGIDKISKAARETLTTLLLPEQANRLNEILLQHLGNASFVRDDISAQLQYTAAQRKRMTEITTETEAAITKMNKDANERKSKEPLEKRYVKIKTDEQKKLIAALKPDQLEAFKKMLGSPFPLAELRRPAFKVPELVNTDDWINSPPLELNRLRGKVVVVHFYASGCSNCIHNYPWYRQWHEQFQGKDVVLIGIHTPETANERDSTNVRRKAVDEKLAFPILIDGKSEKWNAWGNSMWPAVYLVDKRGYLRDFWPGELKWQGNDGEKYLREKIVSLLAEPKP